MGKLALGLLLVVGCGVAEQDRYAAPELSIWVEESDYFKASDVMAGCSAWSVVGVTCRLAATESEASTWVRSYEASEDVHGRAGTDGVVIVNVLHSNLQGTPRLAVILAHEFGHRMGLGHLADGVIGIMSPAPVMTEPRLTPADLREYEATR